MALVNQPAILPGAFAAEGDKNTIPANNDGLSGLASIAKGFPQITQVPLAQGGQPPQRQDFNGIFNLFSQFLLFAQNGGVYAYNNTLDYQPPAIIASDNVFYQCVAENGPSTSAGVQPVTNTDYWQRIIADNMLDEILQPYAKLASPSFTGNPTAPTQSAGNNSTRLATTAFVQAALDTIDLSDYALKTDLNAKAPLASPALTGTPTAPTAAKTTDSTQIATTAFVKDVVADYATLTQLNAKAALASPTFTGTPKSTTPASSDNSTRIATTAFVKALVGAANNGGIVSANLAQNGYVKFANGFILQWGVTATAKSYTFTYPLAMSVCYAAVTGIKSGGSKEAGYNSVKVTSVSAKALSFYVSLEETASFFVIVFGK